MSMILIPDKPLALRMIKNSCAWLGKTLKNVPVSLTDTGTIPVGMAISAISAAAVRVRGRIREALWRR